MKAFQPGICKSCSLLSQSYPFTNLRLYVVFVQNLPVNLLRHPWGERPLQTSNWNAVKQVLQLRMLKTNADTAEKALSAAQVHYEWTVAVTQRWQLPLWTPQTRSSWGVHALRCNSAQAGPSPSEVAPAL